MTLTAERTYRGLRDERKDNGDGEETQAATVIDPNFCSLI